MWVFSKFGFFSVVQAKSEPGRVQVRARVKDDLQRLSAFASESVAIPMPAIITTPHADYAYRIVIEQSDWVKVAAAIAADIDYTNFKSAVHGEANRDAAYMQVWSAMNELQWQRQNH